MGDCADAMIDQMGFQERGPRLPTPQRKPGYGCPKCAMRFPGHNDRRKHLRDVHGLKYIGDGSGKLRPIQKVAANG